MALKQTVTSANGRFPKAWAGSGFSFVFLTKRKSQQQNLNVDPNVQELLVELDQGLAAGSCHFRGKPEFGLRLDLEKQPLFTLKHFYSQALSQAEVLYLFLFLGCHATDDLNYLFLVLFS